MAKFTCVHDLEYSECEECWATKVDQEAYEINEAWEHEESSLPVEWLDDTSGEYLWDDTSVGLTSEVYEAEISLRDMYRVLSDKVSGEYYGWDYN